MFLSSIRIFWYEEREDMAIDVLMPALSPTMEEGTISKWVKKEGDKVMIGDVIAEIETDKATMEIEATDDSIIGKILVPEGTEGVKVNTRIAVLLQEGESAIDIDRHAVLKPTSLSSIPVQSASIPNTEMQMLTVREALHDAMAEEMRRDENVFLIGEEVAQYQGAYKVSQGLLEEFGERRIVDTPISEHAFAGLGVGAAFAGLRPIVEFMTFNFAMQAIDQIINSAAKTRYMSGGQMSASVVFRGPNGAAARVAAQHSQCYAAWYGHIPGLKVIMPYTAADAKGLLKAAIRDDNPVIFLENEMLYNHQFEVPKLDDFVLPIGKARIHKVGNDVTLVAFGAGMRYAVEAVNELMKMNIDAELIDLRTIRPMDISTIIESVKKTGRLVTVEEGFPQSSVGTEIATRVMQQAFDWLDAPILTIASKDVPMPYATNLEKAALPSVSEVIDAVRAVTYKL